MKSGVCQNTSECDGGTFPYCHLCHDRECTYCENYSECFAAKCAVSGQATVNAGNCICNAGWGRSGINAVCDECHDGCDSCTVGGQDDFADCTACPSASNDIHDAAFAYCVIYCPTGFDTAPSCFLDTGKEMSLSYDFNKPLKTFTNDGFAGTLDVTPTVVGPSGRPGKNRGIYFDGSS